MRLTTMGGNWRIGIAPVYGSKMVNAKTRLGPADAAETRPRAPFAMPSVSHPDSRGLRA
jgi:hypothetical protein